MHQSVAHAQEEIISLKAEIELLRTRIAKLEAALRDIAKGPTWTGQGAGWPASIARAALAEGEEK